MWKRFFLVKLAVYLFVESPPAVGKRKAPHASGPRGPVFRARELPCDGSFAASHRYGPSRGPGPLLSGGGAPSSG